MSRFGWIFIVLAVLVVAAGIATLFVDVAQLQRVAFVIETMILGGLFLVTAYYANKTSDIAEATRKLAEEAKEQRLAMWEPLIQPYVRVPEQIVVTIRENKPGLEIICANEGQGYAYKIKPIVILNRDASYCSDAWDRGQHPGNEPRTMTRESWPDIPPTTSQKWQIDARGADNYVAAVLYKDRFGRQFISGYGFRMEQDGIRPTEAIPPRLFKESQS